MSIRRWWTSSAADTAPAATGERRGLSRFTGAVAGSVTLILLLLVDGLARGRGEIDNRVVSAVQGVDIPLISPFARTVDAVTSIPLVPAVWALVFAGFALSRRWLPALAVLGVTLVVGLHALVQRLVDRDQIATIPSGQVVGTVLLYGLLFLVARGVARRSVRMVLWTLALVMIVATGFAVIWLGAQWPADVFAGYAVGGLLLTGLIRVYQWIDAACGDLPFIHAGYIPHDESLMHAHALTSTIIFAPDTVAKIYAPGFVPRAIYWLAFQAEFAYLRNQAALRAAVLRRNLAGMLTEYWYGSNRVARAIAIEEIDGRYAIVSERIHGHEPRDHHAARAFLLDLANRFEDAGLPTWQIDPRQPRAIDNILETAGGVYQIIDLESGLVSPLESPRAWRRAFHYGLVPLYDDIFFELTRAYLEQEGPTMRATRGEQWFAELQTQLDQTEAATAEWHASEPRIWSRIVRRARHPFTTAGRHARTQADAEHSARALRWIEGSIAAWQADGRISDNEASRLRIELHQPQFLAVLPHFGVHLTVGVLMRFPIGSITRASYTLVNLLLATLRLLFRRIDRRAFHDLTGVHHPLVILIAAMPGIGTFAYLASRPFRFNHLLLRVSADAALTHIPLRVYERTGLRWIVARPKATDAVQTPLGLSLWAQTIVVILGIVAGGLFALDVVSKMINHLSIIDPDTMGWKQIARIVDLGSEASLGTWYQVLALTLLGGLLAIIGAGERQRYGRFARHWLILALLCLGFSIDEQAKLHDAGGGTERLREQLGMGGLLYYGWVIVGLLSVLIIALAYWRFVFSLPAATRNLFIVAAGLFVGGEVVLESVSGWYLDAFGLTTGDFFYQLTSSVEEFLGMAGVLVAIAAALQYVQATYGEVRLTLGPAPPAPATPQHRSEAISLNCRSRPPVRAKRPTSKARVSQPPERVSAMWSATTDPD